MFNIILAVDSNYGIGKSSFINLPWDFKQDLKYFKSITTHHTNSYIIMGRKTADTFKKPLPNRKNIVITSQKDYRKSEGFITYSSIIEVIKFFFYNTEEFKAFIIGGSMIVNEILNYPKYIDNMYITRINHDYECDIKVEKLEDVLLNYDSSFETNYTVYDEEIKKDISIHTYKYTNKLETDHIENKYLEILKKLLYAQHRQTRNGLTLSKFGTQIEFNLKQGFPILTTKRVYWKGVVEELLFFLSGNTNNKILKDKKVNIWNSNTSFEFINSIGLDYKEHTMGPMYGFQWRYFNAEYKGCNHDYTGQGTDQLEDVINLILNDPFSRRILLTTYNVNQTREGVLYPCHGLIIQFYVNSDYSIDCQMYQRSCDWFLGVPFNIASYALLLHIIINIVNNKKENTLINYSVGKLIIVFGDYHLYESHIDAALIQISRYPKTLPQLNIKKNIDSIVPGYFLDELNYNDFELIDYKCGSKISAQIVA